MRKPSVLVIGKPNSGKTLLFNRLTGLHQKVANFPGVTVDVKRGQSEQFEFIDIPGIYSLDALTADEQVAVQNFYEEISKESLKVVLCLLDGTRLEQSLVLGLQAYAVAKTHHKPIVFALNMMDELIVAKQEIDLKGLATALQSPVIGISAKKRTGLASLTKALETAILEQPPASVFLHEDCTLQARALAKKFGPDSDILLRTQNKLDKIFLSTVGGGLLFMIIMAFLFQAIFTWATPAMNFVEYLISGLGTWVAGFVPAGIFADFLQDAIFAGFGSFLVFVPQIFILTMMIGFLEDTGYLARAAVICHKPLSLFGLSGRSFVPLLTGHACAIPAILSARMIESPRKRFLTMLVVPFTACSARLPVYAVLVSALIPPISFGGIIGLQGLSFFALYLFGIVTALLVAGILDRGHKKTEGDAPFIIEFPPYRLPHGLPLLQKSLNSAWTFVTKAGFIIFTVNAVVWFLGYFPNGDGQLSTSFLAQLGRLIEPAFAPLGLDWKYGVAILASFLAREVFVGTLGTLYGIAGADENIAGLAEQIQLSGMSLATGLALLVFYGIALQCASTLAVIKKELGSYRVPTLMFFGYGALAYLCAYLTFLLVSFVG